MVSLLIFSVFQKNRPGSSIENTKNGGSESYY